jgi:DNA repair protein RadC
MNNTFSEADKVVIKHALFILETHLKRSDVRFTDVNDTKDYLKLSFAEEDREVFGIMFLDQKNHLLSFEKLFAGTTGHVPVYCKEIAKAFVKHNASAVILTHNHPSGCVTPSAADLKLTERIVNALKFFEGQVLDHIIVSKKDAYSFAEHGQMLTM